MKQRITVEQLNELTPEKKEKLREWWRPQEGDCIISGKDDRIRFIGRPCNGFACQFFPFANFGNETDLIPINLCLPHLSIGQCIELLGHKLQKIEYDFFINNYYVSVLNIGTNGKTELIDALFAAVKEAL